MKAPNALRRLICLIICFAMVLQPMMFLTAAAESTELITNGSFADGDGDGKADGWSYYIGSAAECPSTVGEDGITISADSTIETQRLTVHQTVSGLTAGNTYHLTPVIR